MIRKILQQLNCCLAGDVQQWSHLGLMHTTVSGNVTERAMSTT